MVRHGSQQALRVTPVLRRRRLLAAAAALLVVTAVPAAAQDPNNLVSFGSTEVVVDTLKGRKKLKVLYARTPRQLAQGLMFRRRLAPWDGMFFDMTVEQPGNFWMKNTYIPLDIVFIRADGTVDSVRQGKPHSEVPVLSKGPIRGVLELRRGRAGALGIEEGSVIRHRLFRNVE